MINQILATIAGLALGLSISNALMNRQTIQRINAIEIKLEIKQ